jgi:hypothetical protein
VDSTISCIVIKSDHRSKKIPYTGEIVGVAAEVDLFVVMHVDTSRQVAQLMERSGKHRLFDVPFSRLCIFNRTLAETIRRFLELREDAERHEARF